MLQTKKGFVLKSVGHDFMVLTVGEATEKFHGIIRFNETGAFLWKELEQGIEKEELIQKMLQHYEGLGIDRASKDLNEYLDSIRFAIEEK